MTTVVAESGRQQTRKNPKRMNRKQRRDELLAFIELCFEVAETSDLKELANATQLSVSTLYRLRGGKVTTHMEFGTLQQLGYAVGLKLEMNHSNVKVSLVD